MKKKSGFFSILLAPDKKDYFCFYYIENHYNTVNSQVNATYIWKDKQDQSLMTVTFSNCKYLIRKQINDEVNIKRKFFFSVSLVKFCKEMLRSLGN